MESYLNLIKKVGIDTFGENFFIKKTTNSLNDNYYKIFILYPKLTITNEHKQSIQVENHIQSLGFSFREVDNRINFSSGVDAITLKPTLQQYIKGYLHSHLSSGYDSLFYRSHEEEENNSLEISSDRFKSFCLGRGPIRDTINEIRECINTSTPVNSQDESCIQLLFLNLIDIASTESLLGRPYIYLRNITLNNKSTDRNISNQVHEFNDFYMKQLSLKNLSNTPLDFSINKNRLVVKDNEKLEDHLINAYDNYRLIHNNNLQNKIFCHKDTLGNYFSCASYLGDDTFNEVLEERKQRYVLLGNKKIYFQLSSEIDTNNNLKKYLHPKIKENVKKYIETIANREAIKCS